VPVVPQASENGIGRSLLLSTMMGVMCSASAAINARESWCSENSGSAAIRISTWSRLAAKRLGPDFILSVKQVASWFQFLDGPLVLCCLPLHPVADHRLAFLPAGWQMMRRPSGVSTTQWRPCPATTSPVSSNGEGVLKRWLSSGVKGGQQRIDARGAVQVCTGDAVTVVGAPADCAALGCSPVVRGGGCGPQR
jgi:hypothetical protein